MCLFNRRKNDVYSNTIFMTNKKKLIIVQNQIVALETQTKSSGTHSNQIEMRMIGKQKQ